MLFEGTPCLAWIREFIASVFFPRIRVQLPGYVFGPYCCLYPMTIPMNGMLSRIPWRVRYLTRGTIDRFKTCGLSPELQVKGLCVPVFRQRLVRKLFWYVYCVAVAICKSHETFVVYLRPVPDFTLLNTLCLHYYFTFYLCS